MNLTLPLWRWTALLTTTLNPDPARAGGVDPQRETLWSNLALALMAAVAVKVAGVLLISALLAILPATVHPLAQRPKPWHCWRHSCG